MGSTTTKARWLQRTAGGWRLGATAQVPTTVERPVADVMIGVGQALDRLTDLAPESAGLPLVATSSAGGGLQVAVLGLRLGTSGQAAAQAVLGAGGYVSGAFALDDGRAWMTRILRLAELRPDAVLFVGGVDQAEVQPQLLVLGEILRMADVRSRWSPDGRVPVVFAGNAAALRVMEPTLADHPVIGAGNVLADPRSARDKLIHIFLEHVIRAAPGYDALRERAAYPVLPTPVAFATMLESWHPDAPFAAFDIGGATTDVFSGPPVRRTVSASLGMSYHLKNALASVDPRRLRRWLSPEELARAEAYAATKMIRAEALPDDPALVAAEVAIAREILALAWAEHLASGAAARPQLLFGSGGMFAHHPPEVCRWLLGGVPAARGARYLRDRAFIAPHLGAIATAEPDAALSAFLEASIDALPTTEHDWRSVRRLLAVGGEPVPAAGPCLPVEVWTEVVDLPPGAKAGASLAQLVARDDILAESDEAVRGFPWIIRAWERLRVQREEMAECVVVAPGDAVARRQIIARAIRPQLCTFLRSPVDGFVVGDARHTGVVVIREKPAGAVVQVKITEALHCTPAEARGWLLVKEGDAILAGSFLAGKSSAIWNRPATGWPAAPISGIVSSISPDVTITIDATPARGVVVAPAPGVVASLGSRQIALRASGWRIEGTMGVGGEAWGLLQVTAGSPGDVAGAIVAFAGEFSEAAARRAVEAGAAGVIGGSLPVAALESLIGQRLRIANTGGEDLTCPLVLLDGFGPPAGVGDRLAAADGRLVRVSGVTQVRAGARRPYVAWYT